MADSHPPFLGMSWPQHQDHDVPMPSYPQDYDFSPGYNNPQYGALHHSFMPQYQQPGLSSGQRPSHLQLPHYPCPHPAGGVPAAPYMGYPGGMFQYNSTGTRAWPPLTPQNYRPEPSSYPRYDEERRVDEMFSTQGIGRHPFPILGLPSYVSPPGHSNPQWAQEASHSNDRRPPRPVHPANPFPSDPFGVDAEQDEIHNLEDLRNNEFYHPNVMFRRRASHQRPSRQNAQDSTSQERRRSSRPADGPASLPDLIPMSRNSNRRSFDRYLSDLPGGAPESNGSTRSPGSRATERVARRHMEAERAMRRQRTVQQLSFRRISRHDEDHPNVPSTEQLQELRDKLRHFLPSELPEGADAMCDICQKDYSAKHVDPSEDDEVAIQLPCMHIFGEHCINTWFETCKKHKNKITCPMCRKLLIEPRARGNSQSSRQLLERLDRLRREDGGRPLFEGLPRVAIEARVAGEM